MSSEQKLPEPKPARPKKHTYAIVGIGTRRVKIGSAVDVYARGRELQVGSPVELVLIATRPQDVERKLHHEAREDWVHGEWFRFSFRVELMIKHQMVARFHSFAEGVPADERGARRARKVYKEIVASEREHCDDVGEDAFGWFGHSKILPQNARADMVKGMSFNQRIHILRELKRINGDMIDI